MTVTLGPNPCTNPTVNAAGTSATCTIPAHGPGMVDVTLTRLGQTVALTNGYLYAVVTPLPAPQSPGTIGGHPATLPPVPPPPGNISGSPSPLPPPRPA